MIKTQSSQLKLIEDGGKAVDADGTAPVAQPDLKKKQKGKSTARGVDPSGTIPDYDLIHLQVEFDRALKTNARFQEQGKCKIPRALKARKMLRYLVEYIKSLD
ncbi:hypothetical protein Dimus_013086 [Dionaea muscipula]